MAVMFHCMQSLGAALGFAPPPPLFSEAEPPQFYTPLSMKVLVVYDIYVHLVSHMQSLFCVESINDIKQLSWFDQPFTEAVQLATSLMFF
jgi:hypothetical protein